MQTYTREAIFQMVRDDLRKLLKADPEIRQFVLMITSESHPNKTETDSRFDSLLEELKQDRLSRDKKLVAWEKKWDEERKENQKKWDEQQEKWAAWEKKWDEERKENQGKWAAWEKKWDEERKENQKKWDEQQEKWVAWEKKWDEERKENQEKWAAWEKKWDEERKEDQKKWDEQQKKWDEQEKKWAANQKIINENTEAVKKLAQKQESSIGALGARWGLQSEAAFRNGLRGILEQSFGVTVERYLDHDPEGIVFGRPDQVELDVIIHNGTLILCEIKSSLSKSDMYIFWHKKNYYEKKHNRKADRAMVISPMIDPRARDVGNDLGIEMFGYAEDVTVMGNE